MVTALRPRSGPPRQYRFPASHDETLAGGIRLVTARVDKLPVVSVLILVDAGASRDTSGKEGVAALTISMLAEGTKNNDGAELAEKFEQLGTSLESGADWDSAVLKITVLSEKLEKALELLGEVLTEPTFPEREIERLKAERLAELLQLQTEPRGLADEKFAEFLYSDDSRYGKPDEGSEETVRALSRQDVLDFYASNYIAPAVTVVVAGDIDRDNVRDIVTRTIGKIATGDRRELAIQLRARHDTPLIHIVHKPDAPQSELRVGHIGLPRLHPDFFPTVVMNAVLGGLFGSRIIR